MYYLFSLSLYKSRGRKATKKPVDEKRIERVTMRRYSHKDCLVSFAVFFYTDHRYHETGEKKRNLIREQPQLKGFGTSDTLATFK